MKGWRARLSLGALAFLVVLCGAVLAARRPGNGALYPPRDGDPSIAITVVSHGYHAGVVIPREALARVAADERLPALANVTGRFNGYVLLEIGWGDEGFYRGVPTIADLRFVEALRALLMPGNRSVLHVVGLQAPPRAIFTSSEHVDLTLSGEGFRRLVRQLEATFAREAEEVIDLGTGLYGPSAFYRAEGSFNLFNVCNHWLARLLDAAGVPTNPVLATLPQGLFLDLNWRSGVRVE